MYVSDEALVLRRRKFSETSLVLACLTREHGRIDALAKGARREKSPMKGHFDLYTCEEVTFFRKRNGALDLAIAAALVDEYTPVRENPTKFAAAGIIAELLLHGCLPGQPHPKAFVAAVSAMRGISTGDIYPSLVRGVLELLRDFGFFPQLDNCCRCGCDMTGKNEPAVLSGRAGGLLCGSCLESDEFLPVAALKSLRLYAGGGKVKFSGAPWQRMLLDSLEGYCSYVLERQCRSFKVFAQLWEYQTVSI